MSSVRIVVGCMIAGVFTLAALFCPLCGSSVADLRAERAHQVQATETATVRLHISGMTCGTCPATARLALRRLDGVFSATVTLDDSLGLVRYDPQRLRPEQIAAHLTRITGYRATVLDTTSTRERRRP